jgi:signal transduction histidine kinase
MIASNDLQNIWTYLYTILFLIVIIEIEKYNRYVFHFLRHTRVVNEKNRQIQSLYSRRKEISQCERSSRRLCELETVNLHALIGKVSHDLKTPLQTIRMEFNMLRSLFSNTSNYFDNHFPSPRIKNELSNLMQPYLQTLDGTLSFMTLAINRYIDYSKISNNIPLSSNVTNFDFIHSIKEAIACMHTLDKDLIFNLHYDNTNIPFSNILSNKGK